MLCHGCSNGTMEDTIIIEQWPGRMSDWLLRQGQFVSLPRHNPDCIGIVINDMPTINSPEKNGIYEISATAPLEYQKILFQGSVTMASSKIHWFLDKKWYATCKSGSELFYLPAKGKHELMCMDDFGRSKLISFEVK